MQRLFSTLFLLSLVAVLGGCSCRYCQSNLKKNDIHCYPHSKSDCYYRDYYQTPKVPESYC